MTRNSKIILHLVIASIASIAWFVPVAAQSQPKEKRAIVPRAVPVSEPSAAPSTPSQLSLQQQRNLQSYAEMVAQFAAAQETVSDAFAALYGIHDSVTVELLQSSQSDRRLITTQWIDNVREKTSRSIALFREVQPSSPDPLLNRQISGQLAGRDSAIAVLRGLNASADRTVALVMRSTPGNQSETMKAIQTEKLKGIANRMRSISSVNLNNAANLPNSSPSKGSLMATV